MIRGPYRIERPVLLPDDDDDRDATPLNQAYENRVKDARSMLRCGKSHEAIRQIHGGAVLAEVLESERESRRFRR